MSAGLGSAEPGAVCLQMSSPSALIRPFSPCWRILGVLSSSSRLLARLRFHPYDPIESPFPLEDFFFWIYIYLFCVYMHMCGCTGATVNMWRSECSLRESVVYHVNHKGLNLGRKSCHPAIWLSFYYLCSGLISKYKMALKASTFKF